MFKSLDPLPMEVAFKLASCFTMRFIILLSSPPPPLYVTAVTSMPPSRPGRLSPAFTVSEGVSERSNNGVCVNDRVREEVRNSERM